MRPSSPSRLPVPSSKKLQRNPLCCRTIRTSSPSRLPAPASKNCNTALSDEDWWSWRKIAFPAPADTFFQKLQDNRRSWRLRNLTRSSYFKVAITNSDGYNDPSRDLWSAPVCKKLRSNPLCWNVIGFLNNVIFQHEQVTSTNFQKIWCNIIFRIFTDVIAKWTFLHLPKDGEQPLQKKKKKKKKKIPGWKKMKEIFFHEWNLARLCLNEVLPNHNHIFTLTVYCYFFLLSSFSRSLWMKEQQYDHEMQ